MTYKRFEELPVWKAAIELFVGVCRATAMRDFPRRGDLVDQLERAALSVSNNIAEGFERGTTGETLTFLYIARASAGEVRSALCAAEALQAGGVARMGEETMRMLGDLRGQCESIGRQIRGWADSMQNGDIRGQRHLTEESKGQYQREKRATAFIGQLKAAQEEGVRRMRDGGSESQI